MEWLGGIIERLGLPIGLLLAILFGLWRTIKWLGPNLIIPVRDGHLSLLKKLEGNDDKQTASLVSLAEAQKKQTEIMGQLACLNGKPRDA